jgi:aryl-alcohol dehydrogenase-like predicted oxidoreductase
VAGGDRVRLVLGTQVAEPPAPRDVAFEVFDAWWERGFSAFDTARAYGDGATDAALGEWLETRGVRDVAIVVGKGAHTPHCDPEHLTIELEESLELLRTDRLDVYLLHRDNPDVPVAEFIDALDEHQTTGRIGAFGGSNWTSERIDAANAYARENGRAEMTYLSNQLSLARMVAPTYPGTVSAGDPAFRSWLEASGLTNLAWSSQAAGFFAGLQPDGFLAHAWFDDDNLERRRRAEQLAAEVGCSAVQVALAWVLHQGPRVVPIIGPRSVAELDSSLRALDVQLDDDQVAWLDLRT